VKQDSCDIPLVSLPAYLRQYFPALGACCINSTVRQQTLNRISSLSVVETAYSFVITIDLVSIDSRGAVPVDALGLSKDTCGQTWDWVSAKYIYIFFGYPSALTTSMGASFGVIHHEDKWFRWSLLLKPIPFMIRVVIQVVHLPSFTRYDAIGRHKIIWFD
jgi:hypothetical protein